MRQARGASSRRRSSIPAARYCSQNLMPVHLGIAATARVDVEVTLLTNAGRRIVARRNIDPRTTTRPLVISDR